MATVPIYDLPTQDASVGNMPAFQAPGVEPMRDFTGEQLQKTGQAVQSFGTTVMKIADRLQGEVDDAKAKELYNNFAAQADTIETQYLTLKGKDAVGAAMKTKNDLEAALTDVVGKADNDVQKIILRNSASVRLRSAKQFQSSSTRLLNSATTTSKKAAPRLTHSSMTRFATLLDGAVQMATLQSTTARQKMAPTSWLTS
jgi:hypothetical protein